MAWEQGISGGLSDLVSPADVSGQDICDVLGYRCASVGSPTLNLIVDVARETRTDESSITLVWLCHDRIPTGICN